MVGNVGDTHSFHAFDSSGARARTRSRPLKRPPKRPQGKTPAPARTPMPDAFLPLLLAPASTPQPSPQPSPHLLNIPVSPHAQRRQCDEAQRLAEDVAAYVTRLSLLAIFGDALTRAQRWTVRDTLRAAYLPALALDGRLRLPAATAE